jgi:hypothetical protein
MNDLVDRILTAYQLTRVQDGELVADSRRRETHQRSLKFSYFTRKRLLQQYRHETDMPKYLGDVRCWVNSGNHMLSLSFSGFDPNETSAW